MAVKLSEIKSTINRINNKLNYAKSKTRIILGQRYGYKALDYGNINGGIEGTLITGISSRQVKDVLNAIEFGIDCLDKNNLEK